MPATKPTNSTRKNVPANALRLEAGVFEFGNASEGSSSAPIKMLGRSAEPINHWYWGKIIHDMAGFSTDHPTVPIDWSHDATWEEGIGYLSKFKADNKGLFVEGQLVSIEPNDRAAKLMKKAAAGVPYQASIFFRADRLEQVPEGFSAKVNGFTVEGPAIIVRQWALRGMAICLYGADHRTQSQFSDGDEVAVEIFSLEPPMSKDAPAKLTDKPADDVKAETKLTDVSQETKPETKPETKLADSDPRAELKKFVAAFGAQNGAEWFSDGVSFADAQGKHVEVLAAQLTSKQAELDAMAKKLSSIDRGEKSPLTFNDGDKPEADKKTNDKFAQLGTNLSKFAGSIKLPARA